MSKVLSVDLRNRLVAAVIVGGLLGCGDPIWGKCFQRYPLMRLRGKRTCPRQPSVPTSKRPGAARWRHSVPPHQADRAQARCGREPRWACTEYNLDRRWPGSAGT